MEIPAHRLSSIKRSLHRLVDERTSAPWADYSEDDRQRDEQDREDIEKIQTVADVLNWLQQQGGRALLVEYASCLDPLGGFKVEGKENPDESDEAAFRDYLKETYNLPIV